tara:strand:- start:17570 stop:18211 length:642 start_codon:yes stop_codon:yes gene_type:complete
MSNRVDYPGRTSCGCPYLNQPDPEQHWKDCHYRLNAQQAEPVEPAPAQDERDAHGDMLYRLSRLWDEDECPSFSEVAAFLNANARPAQTEQRPTVKECLTVQPMAYAVFADNGNVILFSTQRDHPGLAMLKSEGKEIVALAPIAQAEQRPFTAPDGYVLVPEDQIIESDDYGIYGSTFHYCKLCQSESGAGMLNKGIPHKPGCALSAMDAKEE